MSLIQASNLLTIKGKINLQRNIVIVLFIVCINQWGIKHENILNFYNIACSIIKNMTIKLNIFLGLKLKIISVLLFFVFLLVTRPGSAQGTLSSALRNHSWQSQGDKMKCGDQNQVIHMQGKQPTVLSTQNLKFYIFWVN